MEQNAPDMIDSFEKYSIPDTFRQGEYNYDVLTVDKAGEPSLGLVLVYLALVIVVLASMWKVYTKARKPGWAAFVPIYNAYILLQIIGRPWWWLLAMFIPFVNLIVAIVITHDTAKVFGKGIGWTLGLLFLPFIFYPMLAFGSAKYLGPAARRR